VHQRRNIHPIKVKDQRAKTYKNMKNIKIAFALLATVAFTGCIGDHGVGNGQDTAQNTYQVRPDKNDKDTANIIRYTGDSQSMDYSANGGAGLIKLDTSIKK